MTEDSRKPFWFAPTAGNRKKLLYCSVLCGRAETLTEVNGGEHIDYNLGQGFHSVLGKGHWVQDETIVYRYGQAKPLLIVTVEV